MKKWCLFLALALVATLAVCGGRAFSASEAAPLPVDVNDYLDIEDGKVFDLDSFAYDSGWQVIGATEDPSIWATIVTLASPDNYHLKIYIFDPPPGFYEEPHPAILTWEYEPGSWVGEYELDIIANLDVEEYFETPYGIVGSTTVDTISRIMQRDLHPGICPFSDTDMIHCAADADGNFIFHDEHDAVTYDYY